MIPATSHVLDERVPIDSIRSALDRVYESGEFDWSEPSGLFVRLADLWRGLIEWIEALGESHPILYWVLIGALAVLALVLTYHLGYLTWRGIRSAVAPTPTQRTGGAERRDAAFYLSAADRLRSEGRYAEAVAHRFIALLLALERNNALRFHPSKTPAEYLREIRLTPEGQAAFRDLVRTLYRFLFGGVAPTSEDFDAFDRRAGDVGGQVAAG
jgi:hypothetical protein